MKWIVRGALIGLGLVVAIDVAIVVICLNV